MGRRGFLKGSVLSLMGLGVLGLAACGDDKGSTSGGGNGAYTGSLAVTLYSASTSAVPTIIAENKGYFTARDLNLKVNDFSAGADAARAIAGQTNLGAIGAFTGFAAYSAGLKGLRMVATGFQPMTVVFLVGARSSIQTVADLKGKKIAMLGGKSIATYLAEQMLASAHLTLNDVQVITVKGTPEGQTAVETGLVDCAASIAPLSTASILAGKTRLIFDPAKEAPQMIEMGLFAGKGILDSQPDVVKRYIEGARQGQEFIRSNPDEAASIWATTTKLDPKVTSTLIGQYKEGFVTDIPRAAVEETLKAGKSLDLVSPDIGFDDVVDPQFVTVT
jgi:ABC-type nitrate/sulfonate/bicarbonate transport system substrate-binding protein